VGDMETFGRVPQQVLPVAGCLVFGRLALDPKIIPALVSNGELRVRVGERRVELDGYDVWALRRNRWGIPPPIRLPKDGKGRHEAANHLSRKVELENCLPCVPYDVFARAVLTIVVEGANRSVGRRPRVPEVGLLRGSWIGGERRD
jgi:hypothetical protein